MTTRREMALAAFFLGSPFAFARPAVPVSPPGSRSVVPVSGRSPRHDWPKYCSDLEMTGAARGEERLSSQTAGSLQQAWQLQLRGPVASSPIVVGGKLYVGDWSGREWVIDAATGTILSHVNLGTTSAPQCNPSSIGVTSAPAIDSGRLFVAGGDDSFYALDAQSLKTAWKTGLGDNSAAGGYYGWCSPAVVEGRVFQGISSNCDNPFVPGGLVALDRNTGQLDQETLFSGATGPGAGVWTSPAIDLAARSIYVTTASATSTQVPYAYSVVRLSLDDLSIQSAWKLDDFSVSDSDWGSSPTLFFDPSGALLVGAGQKNGFYYAFDRDHVADGPRWKAGVAVGSDCPQCGGGSISTAAFDGSRLYVGGGTPPPEASTPAGNLGSVVALDPSTGEVHWRFSGFYGPVLAPISTANGAVFAAGGQLCVALDAATGEVLWEALSFADLYGGIAISDGRIFFGDVSGKLYCYALPAGD